jgi:hypothetical protein
MVGLIVIVALTAPAEIAPPPDVVASESDTSKSHRWSLRFRVKDAKDYVEQLKVLKAIVVFPTGEKGKALMIPDLTKPEEQRIATEDDLKDFAQKFRFTDSRFDAVKGVSEVLKLNTKPRSFWAFFPHDVEDELARKETAYKGRRIDQIESTVFLMTIRGGKPAIVVVDQTPKKNK